MLSFTGICEQNLENHTALDFIMYFAEVKWPSLP